MSRKRREERNRKRTVKVGVVPDTPNHSRVGVLISSGSKDSEVVIRPDEARTIAAMDTDPVLADQLCQVADAVEKLLAEPPLRGKASLVKPKMTGPEALRDWTCRHHAWVMAFYRSAINSGDAADTVVWLMPRSESLDDPPLGADTKPRLKARDMLNRGIPSMRGSLDDPPRAGHFYVVASTAEGRFKGTFVGMLPIPSAGEDLPPVRQLPGRMVVPPNSEEN